MKKILTHLANDKLTLAGSMLVTLSTAVFVIVSLWAFKNRLWVLSSSTTCYLLGLWQRFSPVRSGITNGAYLPVKQNIQRSCWCFGS